MGGANPDRLDYRALLVAAPTTLIYRAARQEDVPAMGEVVRSAYNALSRQHGFAEIPVRPPSTFQGFSIKHEPAGCWIAEDSGRVVGIAISWVRDDLWFLAQLFIDPSFQAHGVGGALLERALTHGRNATNRALVTFAYNPVSIGFYVRHAMYPRAPLYRLEGRAERFRSPDLAEAAGCDRLEPDDRNAVLLGRLDDAVLGVDRTRHHEFFLSEPAATCYVIAETGAPTGYAYVWSNGHVGPLAATSPASFERIMTAGLALAARSSSERVSLILAGSNAPAMSWALGAGMHIELPLLLMATKPFGRLEECGFHSPALL